MTEEVVLYERRGPAAWITLNRPDKLNALNREIVAGLHAGMDRALRPTTRSRSSSSPAPGRAFSAGFDISPEAGEGIEGAYPWREELARDVDVTMRLWSLPKPTIAAVRGWCLGGACELAMACDLIVAAEDARLGEPEIRFGSGPVTLLMPFVLGQKKTNELLFTGDAIEARGRRAARARQPRRARRRRSRPRSASSCARSRRRRSRSCG